MNAPGRAKDDQTNCVGGIEYLLSHMDGVVNLSKKGGQISKIAV
jgi:hypothetical protein